LVGVFFPILAHLWEKNKHALRQGTLAKDLKLGPHQAFWLAWKMAGNKNLKSMDVSGSRKRWDR